MAGDLIPIERARELVLERVPGPISEIEQVPLAAAHGRVLGAAVVASDPVPPFDGSAMDGFAVRAADTRGAAAEQPARLRLVDESRAGHPAERTLGPGEAIAISTGAVVPEGSDAVVRVEDTRADRDVVEILVEVAEGHDIRRAGEDIRSGETILRPGTQIDYVELGVLGSVGCDPVPCRRRPAVAVVVSGDELVAPSEPLSPGQIHDSNALTIPALVANAGAAPLGPTRARDDLDATRAALAEAIGADIAVVTGGVSVGEHDHVKRALADLGVEEVFWGVALRPGRPTWFGVGAGGSLVFGLPGNPVSAVVTFLLFVRPAIDALLGRQRGARTATAILDSAYEKQPGRADAIRVRLELRDDGWHAELTKAQGSHILTSLLGADGLAVIGTDSGSVAAGERVEVLPLPGA